MNWRLPADRARLLALAIAQENLDAAVRDGWQAVVSAVLHGWILPGEGRTSIPAVLARLERLGLVIEEDYALELVEDDRERLVVSLVGERWTVPTQPFLAALRQLDADFRAGKGLSEPP